MFAVCWTILNMELVVVEITSGSFFFLLFCISIITWKFVHSHKHSFGEGRQKGVGNKLIMIMNDFNIYVLSNPMGVVWA